MGRCHGQTLPCEVESENASDPYAIQVSMDLVTTLLEALQKTQERR